MEYDGFKPRGATKASKADAGGAVLRTLPVFGVVKNNIDPIRSGRLQVYISDGSGSDPDDSSSWATVSYMSPFYGVTTPSGANTGWGEYIKNPNSYGVWNSPPDIGTTVICMFINGDPNYGFWIGCVPQPDALQMVPAIGGSSNIVANAGEAKGLGGAVRLPVTNINTNNPGIANTGKFLTDAKPVHSYVASILAQQGLVRDPIRGVIGSSAQRESPSRVGWGVSTPGRPIYEGGFTDENITTAAGNEGQASGLKVIARRGGHTLVMDDGDILGKDQLVRLRSSLGHQILMSDDGQCLHIIHANGQSWVELGKEGTIDMYSTNSVNVRTQGDLNLHADNNININAGKALNISANTIALSSEKQTTQKVGTNFSLYASGTYTTKVDSKMSFASGGDAFFYSKLITYINGTKKINLNTGASSLIPQDVKPIPITAHTDTLNDATKGWLAAPGKLLSIVSRAPAHAPWASANQGVDVKVNSNASSALPSAPKQTVLSAIANAGAPTNPVSVAAASTVPPVSAVSEEVSQNVTGAIMATMKNEADRGIAAAAVKLGAGIVQTANGPQAAFGTMALNPYQLESCGFIKPGSATLINNLVASGKTIQQACTPNMFTGLKGVSSWQDYANSPGAQVAGVATALEGTLKTFTNNGVLNGTESASAITPVLLAGFNTGVDNTVSYIKNAADTAIGSVTDAVNGVVKNVGDSVNNFLGSTKDLFASGNFAANMSTVVTGGLNSITSIFSGGGGGDALKGATSLLAGGDVLKNITSIFSGGFNPTSIIGSVTSLFGKKSGPSVNISFKGIGPGITELINNSRGAVAAAFTSIRESLPTLKPGVPQNIKEITEKAIAATQAPSSVPNVNSFTGAVDAITDAAKGVRSVRGIVTSVTDTVNGVVAGVTNEIDKTVSAVTEVFGSRSSISNAEISTGMGFLPGGTKIAAAEVNNADGAVNIVPGVNAVKGLIDQATSFTAGITKLTSVNPLAPSGVLTAVNTLSGVFTKGLNLLKGGKLSLVSLVSAGLSPGSAAQLNAAISAMNSGGSVPIRLPIEATNNYASRPLLNKETINLLDNPKIPPPNFTGNPATASEMLPESELQIFNRKRRDQQKRYNEQFQITKTAKAALDNAVDVMPAGDPAIAELKKQYETEYLKTLTITEELTKLT